MSGKLDGGLNGWQRFTLKVHLSLCSACGLVSKQFAWLQRMAELADDESAAAPRLVDENCDLSPQAAERIKRLMQDQRSSASPGA